MTRFVAIGLAVLGSLAGADVASAQSMPLPNNAVLKFDKFLVEQDGRLAEPTDAEQVRRLLNGAHCTCSEADAAATPTFGYFVTLSAETGLSRPVDIYVGTSCDDPQQINMTCRKVGDIPSIDAIRIAGTEIRIPLYEAVNVNTMGACNTSIASVTVWLMVDADGNGTHDHWVTTAVPKPFTEPTVPGVDTRPPPLPDNRQAVGSERSIEISWDLPADQTDLFFFQALCANFEGDTKVEGVQVPSPKYQRVSDVCSAPSMFTVEATASTLPGEEPVEVVPPPFATLDPAFLCGQGEMGATSLTITGLMDDVPYKVALVAVDNFGNFTGTYFSTTVTPKPVTDFWEELNGRDSAIEGGCLLSTTYGDGNPLTRALRGFRDTTLARSAAGRWLTHAYYATIGRLAAESLPARIAAAIALAPLVALALLWHLLGLPALLALLALPWVWRLLARRLRLRRGHLALAAAAAALLLAPGLAAADDFTPYWEDPAEDDPALEGPAEVKWHAGIRVGPYIPDIDLQFHQNADSKLGPYQAMFGTYYTDDGDGVIQESEKHKRRLYQIMPMLDVERIVWRGFGQIGVGGSLGYMQKTALAYTSGSNEDQGKARPRSSAENTFRLVPLAATVSYRLTYLDDRWGIPVIPYVKGGLAYYIWWMKGPSGTSSVCEGPSPTMCTEDKAYGGTAGVQVSAGIAIRAERIDADAARSMRNSGIQHAGFYGEVFWGRVDGFGSETKLWVGDTTWFAGANFEF
jgi:hypothetical protein